MTAISDDDDNNDNYYYVDDAVFESAARDIQNRMSRAVGTPEVEARHFRQFFGTSVSVVLTLWELLERDSLLPAKSRPKHLLWALHFLKVYPKQSPGCSTVGASNGAVDPKTHRKWSGRSSTPSRS